MIVTGAGRGIGRDISERAAMSGARVALLEVDKTTLSETVEQIIALGGDVRGYHVDLGVEKEVISTFVQVAKDFGRIDVLVNNAMTHES